MELTNLGIDKNIVLDELSIFTNYIEEEKVYKYCLYYSKVLKKMFTKKMGPVGIETIINKLYQTFNTEQELIEELTGQEIKSKIKR